MAGVVFLIIFLFILNQGIFSILGKRHKFFNKKLMNLLFLYHLVFIGIYYVYQLYNSSDADRYYSTPLDGGDWMNFFGTGTTSIHFFAYPFINYMNFSFEMMMVLFGWFGYLSFVYAYLFFRENIPIPLKVFKVDFLVLLLFLPNMHFWTASLGKGAPIFMGMMMFAYAIKNPGSRLITLGLGSLIVYFIRPHVFLFLAVGTVLGYMSGKEKISFGRKLIIYLGMIGGLILAQDQILGVVNLDGSDNLVEDFSNFTEDRSQGLSESGSGVNMASYPLPLKLLTFWFRPLFFDAPGILGFIISAENLIYLLLFFKVLKKDFIKFLKNSPMIVKMSITVFFLTSLAMTFVMSNLGIIMRQKSMVMYFAFFVIYYYLAQKKYQRILKIRKFRKQASQRRNLVIT